MFSSKTGWFAVVLVFLGTVTAANVIPAETAFIAAKFGPDAAQAFGLLVTLVSAFVAKLAYSTHGEEKIVEAVKGTGTLPSA